jgi:ABC-type nitrate/sulfonate/bicarbonate transport system ATPase subunit
MPFIEVKGIAKSFPAPSGVKHVLRDVSLDVERGEFVSIVGAMGTGKSTLLSILAGLTTADTGTITFDGKPLTGIPSRASFVFQNYSLLPWFSALENVRLAVQSAFPTMSGEEQKAAARDALQSVGLGNALSRRPSQLSGGMRQRVAIARAFATKPDVLFLDEPFGALDALTRETLQQELVRLCQGEAPGPTGSGLQNGASGVTTVMITNNVEEAILLSDRIVPMMSSGPATLGTPIGVELSRPRSVAQLAHDEQATHVRAHVIATLTASLGRFRRAQPATGTSGAALLEPVAEDVR